MVLTANPTTPVSFPCFFADDLRYTQMQERQLALFFLDIRNFTPLMASRPLPQVMHWLQQLFAIFRPAIESNQGRIIETTGDGLYAVFGLEDTFERATPSAVQAGLAILEEVNRANQTYFTPHFNYRFQVGIGLHVGKAVVGQPGLGISNHTAVMGYAVNVAARLQTATKRVNNSFVISGDAYYLLPRPPKAAHGQITLKGIPGKTEVYLLGQPYAPALPYQMDLPVAC